MSMYVETMYLVQTNESEPWKTFLLQRICHDQNYSQFALHSPGYHHMTQQDLEEQTKILEALPITLRKLLSGIKLESVST